MASDATNNSKSEKFMNKEERRKCWGARDQYWACLDANGTPNPHEPIPQPCLAARDLYAAECPMTWVKHFDRKYYFEKYKVKLKTQGFMEEQDEKFINKQKSSQQW